MGMDENVGSLFGSRQSLLGVFALKPHLVHSGYLQEDAGWPIEGASAQGMLVFAPQSQRDQREAAGCQSAVGLQAVYLLLISCSGERQL